MIAKTFASRLQDRVLQNTRAMNIGAIGVIIHTEIIVTSQT